MKKRCGDGDAAMNPFLKAQILNMQATLRNCDEACRQAAFQDDGNINTEERKMLDHIHRAVWRFLKDTEKLLQ